MPSDRSSKLETKIESAPSEQLLLGDSDISPQNQEALIQIASLIRLAESFRLGFVKCNQPIQCLQMVERLKEMLAAEADIITVNLKEPVSSLRRAVLQAMESDSLAQKKKAIVVLGFERSIPSEGSAPALDELNQSRDNFPKSFSSPFLIWLPDYALTRLAREAPDFWGWRSGVFEFSPEQKKTMDLLEKTMLQGAEEDRLSLEEQKEHASALEGLIADYREMDRGDRENRALAEILHRLGKIRYLLGDYAAARKLLWQSLEIAQELGDKSSVSKLLNILGVLLAQATGQYDEARSLLQQSLEISRQLGDKRAMASSLQNLGSLARLSGELDEAQRLYQQSLEIAQELGEKRGVAASLQNLGSLALLSNDYDEARRLYQQSLKMAQELGDRRGLSISLHNMGDIAQYSGDYDKARELYQQSLEIDKKLGDKSGVAINIVQLSLLEEEEGHMERALEIAKDAEALLQELKSPTAAQARKELERLKREASPVLKKDQTSPACK